ncbi:MAG: isoprenylcysteine carboxylmethyltransferase family protein [Pseudomonadota bacterium]
MRGFPDLPPLWWLATILLIHLGARVAPGLHVTHPWLDAASWLLLLGALGLIGWSALWFWRKRTPIEPHHVPKALIVEGPYRVSRNPIYLALVLLTLASAAGQGSALGVALAAGLWWVLDRRFAQVEEALLTRSFGAAAEDYLKATRRWI